MVTRYKSNSRRGSWIGTQVIENFVPLSGDAEAATGFIAIRLPFILKKNNVDMKNELT